VGEAGDEPVPLPLDGRLDLHLFHPRDVPALLDAYLPECREAGVLQLEIVHGKGTGALGRRVRALLARRDDVAEVRTAEEARGGWGVTLVTLRPTSEGGSGPSQGPPHSPSSRGGV
jgi:DNA-nicking Smr family endonuclease